MIVLGLDTATPQIGCALAGPDGPLASFEVVQGRRHAETLAPAVDFVLRQAGIEIGAVGAIAVDAGPGLFTGLRVGVATGNALASALGVPIVGLTSLDLLADAASDRSGRLIAAVVDARRAEVYWALYRSGPGGVSRLSEYAVDPPDVVTERLALQKEECLAVGDGALRYAEELTTGTKVEVGGPERAFPSAAVLARLARPLALEGDGVSLSSVAPLYLRKADVRINWQQRGEGR